MVTNQKRPSWKLKEEKEKIDKLILKSNQSIENALKTLKSEIQAKKIKLQSTEDSFTIEDPDHTKLKKDTAGIKLLTMNYQQVYFH